MLVSIAIPEKQSRSDVIEQGHETKVHVKLLVTVKQREARIVCREVYFDLLISPDHNHIFHHARTRLPGELGEFKTVSVKMDRVNVVAGIAHSQAMTLAFAQMESRFHRISRKHRFIDRPQVESAFSRVPF